MVVFVHASAYSIPGSITPIVTANWITSNAYTAIGYLGVPLFVMLSGALLLDTAKADEPMRQFYKKRFNRIGLPLIFWTIVFFAWSYYAHNQPLSMSNIGQGLLTGSYPILWFLYLMVGLYLATPILRVLVKHIDRKKFSLLVALWFVGTAAVPIIHTFTSFSYNPTIFIFTDWAGYYLLGFYLLNTKVKPSISYLILIFGALVAVGGDWYLTATLGENSTLYFHGYLSFNMILASAALFIILVNIPKTRIENGNKTAIRMMGWVGKNTLPIYLLHIIVLETLQLGLLGFLFPYSGLVLVDAIALFLATFTISALLIYSLKKVPYLNKLVG